MLRTDWWGEAGKAPPRSDNLMSLFPSPPAEDTVHHSPQHTPGTCRNAPRTTVKQEKDGEGFDPPVVLYEEITG